MEQTLRKIKYAVEYEIGGYENQVADYDEDTEEYKEAKAWLDMSDDEKVEEIYNSIIDDTLEKEVRFIGTAAIKRFIKIIVIENH